MPTPVAFDISNPAFIQWLETEALPGWFAQQRWYARRAHATAAHLHVTELAMSLGGLVIGLVSEASERSDEAPYLISLIAISSSNVAGLDDSVVIAQMPDQFTNKPLHLVEAAATPHGRRALLQLALGETSLAWAVGPVRGRVFELKNVEKEKRAWALASRALGLEQSNTSLVYNDQVILKLLRRPGWPGEPNPDAEIPLALSLTTDEPLTPPVMGVIQAGDDTGGMMIGTLCRFLKNAESGWDMALADAAHEIQSIENPALEFNVRLSRDLAISTAQLHLALARIPDNEAFKPEPVRAEDLRQLGTQLSLWAKEVFDKLMLVDPEQITTENRIPFHRLIENRAEFISRFDYFRDFKTENENQTFLFAIRNHGDYHLGQVLWTTDKSWQVIDFEGEPKRSLSQRRSKAIALRDVAGMVRSFDYAQAVACRNLKADEAMKERGVIWSDQMAHIFTRTYYAMASELENEIFPLMPESFVLRHKLMHAFVLEKCLYELVYELEHRPEWLGIPLDYLMDMIP